MIATVPVLSAPASEPVVLEGVEVLQAVFEHAGCRGEELLPAGLAPTRPTLVTILVLRAPSGPRGPFVLAQVRLSCRSGARARALVAAQVIDAAEPVVEELGAAWGLGGRTGQVALRRGYDLVDAAGEGFDVALVDPAPIGVHDVQYVTGLAPVRTAGGDERLLQAELEVEPQRVERGRPVLRRFDAAWWGLERVHPAHPVAATIAVGRLTLPALRFLLDPALPPHLGTERL